MEIFNRVFGEIQKNRLLREDGLYTCIPWLGLPKFSTVVPGIEKARYSGVTANSKVGKTQLADYMFMYQPLDFISNHRSNIKIRILYFSLEIGKNAKTLGVISNKLYTKHGLKIDPQNLLSKFNSFILPKEHEDKIKGLEEYFEWFENHVTIIDDIRNPFGIYKYCRNWFEKNGTVHYKTISINGEDVKIMDYYEPKDPDLYTIIIVDNFNLLASEKGGDLKSAIEKSNATGGTVIMMNPQNGLRIEPFKNAHTNRDKDKELVKLSTYLKKIAKLDDFGHLKHKHWHKY